MPAPAFIIRVAFAGGLVAIGVSPTMKVGFCLQDDAMPRTVYWELFLKAVKESDFYTEYDHDILIPFEDTAMETNWPRYGDHASAYIRGQLHDLSENGQFRNYFARIVSKAQATPDQKYLYINMNPFFRAPILLRRLRNVIVADVSLAMFERDINCNTVSMPALPIISSRSASADVRKILASFQGANSHPIREVLKHIADETSIIVNLVKRDRYVGKIDAVNARSDQNYEWLLQNSNFAFVPRGDALFSYRLAEVMSFGCIPIILSDGWVLPFDRISAWEDFSLRVHADAVLRLPQILTAFTSKEIFSRRKRTLFAYEQRFANLDSMVAGLMAEVEILSRLPQRNFDPPENFTSDFGSGSDLTAPTAAFASQLDNVFDEHEWDALLEYYEGVRR